jgi:serine protease Do
LLSRHNGGAAGIIWHPNGQIVTNAHVVGHSQLSVVLPDNRVFKAKVLACDISCDLAILSINVDGLFPIALGDSASLEPGQFVMALGHPGELRMQ